MNKIEPILQEIGSILYGLMSTNNIETIMLRGRLYLNFHQLGIRNVLNDNSSKLLEVNNLTTDKLLLILQNLQKNDFFKDDYWNHFEIILNSNGDLIFNYINIMESDTFPNLNMKGISDLTENEAKAHHIPMNIWQEKIKVKGDRASPKLKTIKVKITNYQNIKSEKFIESKRVVIEMNKGIFLNIKDTLQLIIPKGINASIISSVL